MKEDNEKKKINSWHNPYAVGCLVIVILFAIILGVASKRGQQAATAQQAEVAADQAAQEALPKKPLFESVGDIKSAFNKNIGVFEKSSKLKLNKIDRINVGDSSFMDTLSRGGSHTAIRGMSIFGNIDNGRIWRVGVIGLAPMITDVSKEIPDVFKEFTPYVCSMIKSVDKSMLDMKGTGSIYNELVSDLSGKKSLSKEGKGKTSLRKNGYEYTLDIFMDSGAGIVGITFSAEAVP